MYNDEYKHSKQILYGKTQLEIEWLMKRESVRKKLGFFNSKHVRFGWRGGSDMEYELVKFYYGINGPSVDLTAIDVLRSVQNWFLFYNYISNRSISYRYEAPVEKHSREG